MNKLRRLYYTAKMRLHGDKRDIPLGDPVFQWATALTASQLGQLPLSGWQWETVPFPCRVRIIQNATTVNVRTTVYSGSQTILQKSPCSGGGTAGVMPTDYGTPPWEFTAAANDKLIISNDEIAAGTPTVNGSITIEPL